MYVRPYTRSVRDAGSRHSREQGERTESAPHNVKPLQLSMAGHPMHPSQLVQLQRTVGNAAAVKLLKERQAQASQSTSLGEAVQRKAAAARPELPVQRMEKEVEEAEAETVSMSPEEAETFDAMMNDFSDEELEAAFEAEFSDRPDKPEGEAAAQMKPDPAVAQRTKSKAASISSDKTPNLMLAGKLEKNGKKKPRLVNRKRWRQIKAKYKKKGYRKYVGILHQNLQNDLGTDDLVLLLRVRRRINAGDKLDQHYDEIEKKSSKKGQTAQTRTELLGEAVTSIRMEAYSGGDCELLIGYASGAGIDQLWRSASKKTYYVVEAKGPGAKLKVDNFAVRGAVNGSTLTQMSPAWIKDRIPRLHTSYPNELQELLDDCGLRVNNGSLESDPHNGGTHKLEGIVITAKWDEAQGDIGSGFSKQSYTL